MNKVLTVSYGTFSCRLEGFDDSLETLRSVVTYFHELAGHDRFMDMAPQAPDIEALEDLAAKQSDQPVEVNTDAGAVNLRARSTKKANPTREKTRTARRTPEEAPAQKPITERIRERTAAPEKPARQRSKAEPAKEESAAPEKSIRDRVRKKTAAPEAKATAAKSVDNVVEIQETEKPAAPADNMSLNSLRESFVDDDQFEDDIDIDEDYDDDFDAPEEAAPSRVAQDETPEDGRDDALDDDEDDDDRESVAAKLQRIRAVVGRAPAATKEPAEKPQNTSRTDALARLSEISNRSDKVAQEQAPEPAKRAKVKPAGGKVVDGLDFSEKNKRTTSAKGVAKTPVKRKSPPAPEEHEAQEDAPQNVSKNLRAALAPGAERARKAKAPEAGEAEEASVQKQSARRRTNSSKMANLPDNDDDAMKRMMNQADERLNEPEGRRHRDAFAQLKAAVAATEAARKLGDDEQEADPEDAFRDDLDEAVRADGPADTPATPPLKLVTTQIIDPNEQEDEPAARLRRIAAVKDDAGASGKVSYEDFAAQYGASDMDELLEASAAYITHVEGDDDFSRPQVMKKVLSIPGATFTREDGLRSFGRLLRQNKILKLGNGRFQVASDTRFNSEDRGAAQG